MEKFYTSLGLMSGTSMDGIDASIIRSDGENEYESTFDEFFEYDQALYKDLVNLRNKINSANDIIVNSELVSEIERKITLYHAEICNKIINKSDHEVDLIGFHGQTIFHDASQKISKQLGDGSLLSSLLKKDVIYNFRANDIANGGQGAPLAPIFHNLIINKNKIELPVFILNIGGIANITIITSNKNDDLISYDIGPGNCLLDEWVRKHTSYRYDFNGKAASIGKIDEIDNQAQIEKAAELSLANEVVSALPLGYEQQLGKRFVKGQELSGGQWQKIALARAYMKNAEVMILDEPTSALDAKAESEVFERFIHLIKNKTSVIISHRFSTVRQADRILVLEQGSILESGTHEELMQNNKLYAQLFTLQAEGYQYDNYGRRNNR